MTDTAEPNFRYHGNHGPGSRQVLFTAPTGAEISICTWPTDDRRRINLQIRRRRLSGRRETIRVEMTPAEVVALHRALTGTTKSLETAEE